MPPRFPASDAFDALHFWSGDAVEKESEEFQRGKAQALRKLLPYAQSISQHEAASVVLELDGSEFDFQIGERYSVSSRIPANRAVAHLHTHPDPEPHSQDDWPGFLQIASIRQAHVIAQNATYSLHKPDGWKLDEFLNSRSAIAEAFFEAYVAVQTEALNSGLHLSDLELDELATRKMAARCGILFRIGIRHQGVKEMR